MSNVKTRRHGFDRRREVKHGAAPRLYLDLPEWGYGVFKLMRKGESMNRKICFQVGTFALAFATAGPLIWSSPAHSETAGMERRDDRRDDRQEAQDIRQKGRDVARETKGQCRGAGGSGPECRQTKRGVKQRARKSARDVKRND